MNPYPITDSRPRSDKDGEQRGIERPEPDIFGHRQL